MKTVRLSSLNARNGLPILVSPLTGVGAGRKKHVDSRPVRANFYSPKNSSKTLAFALISERERVPVLLSANASGKILLRDRAHQRNLFIYLLVETIKETTMVKISSRYGI